MIRERHTYISPTKIDIAGDVYYAEQSKDGRLLITTENEMFKNSLRKMAKSMPDVCEIITLGEEPSEEDYMGVIIAKVNQKRVHLVIDLDGARGIFMVEGKEEPEE